MAREEEVAHAAQTVDERPRAEVLIEGAIRMAESDVEYAQKRLIVVIEEGKVAHSNVEFWRDEVNKAVAARQELEESLRRLRDGR